VLDASEQWRTHLCSEWDHALPDSVVEKHDVHPAIGVPATHGAAHRALADAKATADLLRH
jgi:DNA polymerase III epsilon subunit-like protein